jgi:hypothetical protein
MWGLCVKLLLLFKTTDYRGTIRRHRLQGSHGQEYSNIANRNIALHSGPTHFMHVHPLDDFRSETRNLSFIIYIPYGTLVS